MFALSRAVRTCTWGTTVGRSPCRRGAGTATSSTRSKQERGLDFREDLFNPCRDFVFAGIRQRWSLRPSRERPLSAFRIASHGQLPALRGATFAAGAARVPRDQFIVRRGRGQDRHRRLPLVQRLGPRHDDRPARSHARDRTLEAARGILRAFAASVDRGMLPNRFPDAGETPEYNTVDATLWFFEAVRAYAPTRATCDFVRAELYRTCWATSSHWHVRGTRYGIRVDADGLLLAGEPGVQLTWMDAKIGDWVVTPRHGKPVEIQALWYNALRTMQALTGHAHYAGLADRPSAIAFVDQFWNESAGCLYDVVNGDDRDASIRPNQIFAVSLFHSMLPDEMAARWWTQSSVTC